ncbi:MAG: hypothetical protein AAFN92_10380, partial [Bacteroidota bacterium]
IKYVFHEGTNSGWYHLLTPLLFWFMCRLQLGQVAVAQRYLLQWVVPGIFALICLLNVLFITEFSRFPTVPVGVYAITGILLAIGYFLYLLRTPKTEYLEREPMFWVSTGMLVYYSANFLMWSALTFITYERFFFYSIYRVNTFATLFLNVLFSVAILLPKSKEYQLNITT